MPLKKPIKPVIPNLVRKIPPSFAWINHRLRSRQFLLDFEPGEFALYLFLSLAADEQGLSCWQLDIMQRTMPAFHLHQFHDARDALMQKRLLAFKPWNQNDPDSVYLLLPVPSMKPEADHNL